MYISRKKLFSKNSNWNSLFNGRIFTDALKKWAEGIENYWNKLTGSGMTGAEKESAALSLSNAQTLAQEDYARKEDFYLKYESPEAQVRQYKEAGLNPALMYGNGASVSASGGVGTGSAPAPSPSGADLFGALSSIMGVMNQRKKIQNDFEIQNTQNTNTAFMLRNQAEYLRILGKKAGAETIGIELNNDFLQETFIDRVQGAHNESALKAKMIDNLDDIMKQRAFQNALFEATEDLTRSQVKLVSSQTIGQMWQNAILHAQSNYADDYYKATSKLQQALEEAQGLSNSYMSQTLENRIRGAAYEVADIIIRAGMDAKVYNGEAFNREVEGRMTQKEKVQFWTGTGTAVAKTLTTAAVAAYGAGMLGASGSGFMWNGFSPSVGF